MKAYKSLVQKALSLGYTVSVWDGEEWQVKKSTKANEIYAAVESVEEAELKFRDPKIEQVEATETSPKITNNVGWALVSAFGLDDDETVIDHNTYVEEVPHSIKFKWMDQWSDEYMKVEA